VEKQRYTRSQTYTADLTNDQKIAFDLCRAGATWFYNEACRSQLDRYRHRVPVEGFQGLSYAVSVARRGRCDFPYHGGTRLVSEVPVVFLHGALRQLSASWARHLKMTREGRPSGPPGFRSTRRSGSLYWQVQDGGGPCPVRKLITIIRAGTRDRAARAVLRVPGSMGRVTIRYHRELPADATIRFAALRVDDLGRYWVTVQYDTVQVRQPASSGVVGVDVGVTVTAATSDGEVYDAPVLSLGQQQRMARLQRAMARKRRLNPCRHDKFVTVRGRTHLVRGRCLPPGHPDHDCQCWKHSRRYARDKAAFLKLSQRAKWQRTAASHLASRALADKYAVVVVEDLDVSAMTATAKGSEQAPGRKVQAKAGLNREIRASNWYQLRQFTAYKTRVALVAAPRTSQECPRCATVDPANRPERDLFRCVSCGLTGHADIVAAQNIKGRYSARTAAAQSVAAREICLPVGEQPANEHPSPTQAQRGQDKAIILQPTRNLIPQAWGKIGTRKRRRISRRPKAAGATTAVKQVQGATSVNTTGRGLGKGGSGRADNNPHPGA
jgi:transposase